MTITSSSYRLKRFVSSHDPGFAEALLLYVRNTPPTERTDSNEIVFWLDESIKVHDWRFYVFGFYKDERLVGFAEVGYFTEEQLVVFDYLVLDESMRRNNVFYEFVDHLKRYFEATHPEYRYAVAEVCYGPNEEHPSPHARLVTRLLKLQGFRVVHAPYFQPRLLINDPESEMRANLLIYSGRGIETLRTETYLAIVRAIYFKYYLPWNSGVTDTVEPYEKHLREVYTKIEAALDGKRTILVNGHKLVLDAPEKRAQMRLNRVIAFTIQALVAIILLTAAMLCLRYVFGLSDTSFALIYVLAVCTFIALAGIVSKPARQILSDVFEFVRSIWPGKNQPARNKSAPVVGRKKNPRIPDKTEPK